MSRALPHSLARTHAYIYTNTLTANILCGWIIHPNENPRIEALHPTTPCHPLPTLVHRPSYDDVTPRMRRNAKPDVYGLDCLPSARRRSSRKKPRIGPSRPRPQPLPPPRGLAAAVVMIGIVQREAVVVLQPLLRDIAGRRFHR